MEYVLPAAMVLLVMLGAMLLLQQGLPRYFTRMMSIENNALPALGSLAQ
jgi:hypothetical protein